MAFEGTPENDETIRVGVRVGEQAALGTSKAMKHTWAWISVLVTERRPMQVGLRVRANGTSGTLEAAATHPHKGLGR